MRKCAQCGKDIPTGNSTCNYCGYNSNNYNQKQSYSFGKSVSGGVRTMNPKGTSKAGKIILIIFFMMFFGPFILAILMMILFGILFAFDVFEEDEVVCPSYCAGEYISGDGYCYCSNTSDDLNEFDDYFDNIDLNDFGNNIHFLETNTDNLENVVNNGEDAVVVVCSRFATTCNEYAVRMVDIAQKNNFNLFVYKYESLNDEEQDKLMDYYMGIYSSYNPLTFIMSDGRMRSAHEDNMTNSEIEMYLTNIGIM